MKNGVSFADGSGSKISVIPKRDDYIFITSCSKTYL